MVRVFRTLGFLLGWAVAGSASGAAAAESVRLAMIEGLSGPFANAGEASRATCILRWPGSMRAAASSCPAARGRWS